MSWGLGAHDRAPAWAELGPRADHERCEADPRGDCRLSPLGSTWGFPSRSAGGSHRLRRLSLWLRWAVCSHRGRGSSARSEPRDRAHRILPPKDKVQVRLARRRRGPRGVAQIDADRCVGDQLGGRLAGDDQWLRSGRGTGTSWNVELDTASADLRRQRAGRGLVRDTCVSRLVRHGTATLPS